MNIQQAKTIKVTAVIIGLMLLFPPYKIYGFGVNNRTITETGYAMILDLPGRASVDGFTLIVQWAGVCLVSVLAYKFFEKNKQ